MPESEAAPRPDTSDMFAVHGVFRDCLGAAPRLVGTIAPGDAERVALIANYYENVLSFLKRTTTARSTSSSRCSVSAATGNEALIDHMDEQHHEALALLEEAKVCPGRVARR